MKYKVGDRVTHEGYGNGTVIGHYGCGENVMAAVEFDMPQERFHRASAYGGKPGKDNHCWYVGESELTPVNNPSWILIVRPDKSDPDTTTAILKVDGKEVRRESVKRHHKDIYDMQVAIKAIVAKMGCVDAKPPVTAEPPKPEPVIIGGRELKAGSKFILKPYSQVENHRCINETRWNDMFSKVHVCMNPKTRIGSVEANNGIYYERSAIDRILED